MDFNINNHGIIKIGSIEIWITDTLISTWIIMGVLIAFAIVVRIKLRGFKDIPKGFQNVVEYLVETFDNFARGIIGDRLMFLGNWFFPVFAFILLSNICGLFFMRNPTADWATNFALALVTFFLIHFIGIKFRGRAHLKTLIEPYPPFLPLNIIGELARPISLSFRIFGNVLAGMILLGLLYSPVFLRFVIPAPLHAFFDLFSGSIQTYVFCILSLSFISAAVSEEG